MCKLGRIFDDDDALVLGDGVRQNAENGRLSR